MNARRIRYIGVVAILPLLLLAAGGCKEKRPPQATPEAAPKPAPTELDVTLQATVARPPSIASLTHDATAPRRPGDGVTIAARAVVPEGDRLGVEVEGTGWTIPVSSGTAADTYGGSSVVPSVPPGTYKVRATIANAAGKTVADLVADAPITIAPKTTPCEDAQAKLDALRVPFAYDRSDLDPKAKENLAAAAAVLAALKPAVVEVTVEGHCDERGTVEYNLALGNRRAAAVAGYLVDLRAVERNRASKVSFGKERPRNPGHDEAAWTENRRAELKLACGSK